MPKSQQKIIAKTPKGPRVVIGLDVDERNGTPRNEIPFAVAILASVSGGAGKASFAEQQPIKLTHETLDEAIAEVAPTLSFFVDSVLGTKSNERLPVNLAVQKMADLEPERVALQVPDLNDLLQDRQRLRKALAIIRANPRLAGEIEDVLAKGVDQSKAE